MNLPRILLCVTIACYSCGAVASGVEQRTSVLQITATTILASTVIKGAWEGYTAMAPHCLACCSSCRCLFRWLCSVRGVRARVHVNVSVCQQLQDRPVLVDRHCYQLPSVRLKRKTQPCHVVLPLLLAAWRIPAISCWQQISWVKVPVFPFSKFILSWQTSFSFLRRSDLPSSSL